MKNKLIAFGINILLIALFFIIPDTVQAASCTTMYSLDGTPPKPGEYTVCFLSRIWGVGQWIFIVLAIIFTTILIYKTITNRENSKVLETLPTQWMYLIIFFFLAFGAGGIILNFALRLLGFGGVDTWIAPIETILKGWDEGVIYPG